MFKTVITTIAEPTEAMQTLSRRLQDFNANLIAVGDTKGPKSFNLPNAEFLPIEKQLELPFKLAKALPTKHYAHWHHVRHLRHSRTIADAQAIRTCRPCRRPD